MRVRKRVNSKHSMSASKVSKALSMSKSVHESIIPEASKVEESVEVEITLEMVMSFIKQSGQVNLLKMQKAVMSEIERKLKSGEKTVRVVKKTGSMPKGVIPQQLRKPRAWVEFTLKFARENGWEAYVIHQQKKNKLTGEKELVEIEMAEGEQGEDALYVYGDTKKKLTHKDAMSLSKVWWSPKDKTGTREDVYQLFEQEFVVEEKVEKEEELYVEEPVTEEELDKMEEKVEEEKKKEEEKKEEKKGKKEKKEKK